jgi:hypothetical protein
MCEDVDDSTNDIIRSNYDNLETIPQIILIGEINAGDAPKIENCPQ